MMNCKKLMLILLPCALIVGIFGVCFLRQTVTTTYTKNRPKVLAEGEPRLKVQLGHSAEVRAVAFSHDGNFVLTGSEDRTAILWEVTSGKEIRRFVGHKAGINAVAFSPDNRFILTGSGQLQLETDVISEAQSPDATARLWDLNTGKEILLIQAGSGAITSVTFSPDGSRLLAGAFTVQEEVVENVAYVWDAKTGKKIREFKHHLGEGAGSRSYVSFSPDGELALIGFEEDTKHIGPQLWDIAAGKKVRQFSGAEFAAFSHDGHRIFLSNGSILNSRTGELIKRPAISQLAGCVFSSEGQFMACRKCSREDGILAIDYIDYQTCNTAVWDVNKGQQILSIFEPSREDRIIFELHRKDIWKPTSAAVFSSDSNLILIGGDKGGACLYDIGSKEKKNIFQGQSTASIGNFSHTGHFITTENSLWDTAKGKQIKLFPQNEKAILCSDGRQLLLYRELVFKEGAYEMIRERWEGALFDLQTEKKARYYLGQNGSLAFRPLFSPNCQTVVIGAVDSEVNKISVISVSTGKLVREIVLRGPSLLPIQYNAAFSPDGRYIFAQIFPELENGSFVPIFPERSEDGNDEDLGFAGGLFSVESGELIRRFKVPSEWGDITAVSFSPDGRFVILGSSRPTQKIIMFDVSTGKQVNKFEGHSEGITTIAFSPDGRFVLTAGEDRFVILWDAATAKMIRKFESDLSNGLSASFSPDGRFILTGSHDGAMAIWDFTSGKELCRLITFTNGDWFVITPDGRFDTNDLEDIKGLHWVMSSDPLKPLPLEIFMRQYYEPRLLSRVLASEKLKPLPKLGELNRTQPEVRIIDITPDSAETVQVTVEVANVKSEVQKDTEGEPLESGVFDVRLFRNGQLVGYEPKNENRAESGSILSWLTSWFVTEPANDGSVKLDSQGKATVKFPQIKWPRTGVEQVEFSAYAFNADRVKSATDRKTYALTPTLAAVKGRAYLIRLGVNAYEREGLHLRYAANDARRMDDLAARLAARGEYAEVVSVPLISDYDVTLADGRAVAAQDATLQQVREGRKRVTESSATKAHLRAVLDALAGRPADAALLKQIPNADKLRPARPEDLALISVSSHGYTDSDGIFYLVPSDTGTAPLASSEFRSRCVSSDELSLWLRDVDAGELVMIVDACHSAAAVEGTDFKPGPMGSRGLGQLSYDKGMRILTATQADNVALEANNVRQGLLIYALLENGLRAWLADYKPKDKSILLTEWLGYGVERVPRLYEEVKGGRIRGTFDPRELEDGKTQQPSLFDFARRRREVVLARRP